MSETFRRAREEEVAAVGALVAHSFVAQTAAAHEAELRGGPWGGAETLWVAEEGGRLVGACQLLPLRQWIGGVSLPVMGLATVTVAPTHRRRGLAARLVASGLREALSAGHLATSLYPFRATFYQKLGYGLAGEAHQYRVTPQQFPDAPERLRVRLAEGDADRAAVRDLYARWARTQSGQLERTDAAWRRVLEGDARAVLLYESEAGEPEGYVVVRYRPDLPSTERFLDVAERVWLSGAARRGLYAWLGSLGDQWRQVVYRAHVAERFADRIDEPRLPPGADTGWGLWFPSATLLRGPMFRLLDLPGAFRARPAFGTETLRLRLRLRDEQIAENDGEWELALEGGRAELRRDGAGTADASVELSVETLSRVYVGALTPREAVEQGSARLDRPEILPALDAAFHLPRPWTFDPF